MASAIWRLVAIPCILLALFLVGAPETVLTDHPIADSARQAVAATTPAPAANLAPAVRPKGASLPALMPFYVSLATLEALDIHTTYAALERGAVEANPMMSPMVGNKPAFIAWKAATTGGVIWFSEYLRPRNRVAAYVLMAGFNSLYATVLANNYRVLRQLDR